MSEKGLGDLARFLGKAFLYGELEDDGSPVFGPTAPATPPAAESAPFFRVVTRPSATTTYETHAPPPPPATSVRGDPACPRCEGEGEIVVKGVVCACACTKRQGGR